MKRALLAATAAIAMTVNPILATPAFADDVTPITNSDLSPQDVCELVLNPSVNSGFLTEPVDEVVGDWVNDGPPIQGDPVGDPSGYGTPTFSNVFLSNSYFRNGGSPNVWALAEATETFPQTQQLFSFTQNQTRTTTFGCRVWKFEGPDNDILVQPPGLQSTGNSSVEDQTIDLPDQNVITDDDFIITGETVHALICISPNNVTKSKPGTWTGKNGFNAANCPAASITAGGTVPSDNAPDI
jgi:hypothetical protein